MCAFFSMVCLVPTEMFDGIRIRIKLPTLELGLCIMRAYACHGVFVQTGCFGGILCDERLTISLYSSPSLSTSLFLPFLMCVRVRVFFTLLTLAHFLSCARCLLL